MGRFPTTECTYLPTYPPWVWDRRQGLEVCVHVVL